MDVFVLRFLQADSDVFQNETYCSNTETHNTLLYGSIMDTGLTSNSQDHSYGRFYSKSMNCFLSELMFGNMEL